MELRTRKRTRRRGAVAALAVAGVVGAYATVAEGHVRLNYPNGGEVLVSGDVCTIEWVVLIGHDTLNWDLWYSTTGPDGPWIDVAMDLPPGDISSGSVHHYDWTVPETPSETVRVRVRQDNDRAIDYYDYSDGDLTIELPQVPGDADGDGVVDLADYVIFADCLSGPEAMPDPAPPRTPTECLEAFDFDEDSDVDLVNFAAFAVYFNPG